MERKTSVDKIVGKAPEQEKEDVLSFFIDLFEEGQYIDNETNENLSEKAKEKTPAEIKIVNLANRAIGQLRQKIGLESFEIPAKNVHIIEEKNWPKTGKHAGSGGAFHDVCQSVIAKEKVDFPKVNLFHYLTHEMIHFTSYQAKQILGGSDEETDIDTYRMGLFIGDRKGEKKYFRILNEAITEETAKRICKIFLKEKVFEEEIRQISELLAKYPSLKTSDGKAIPPDDILFLKPLKDGMEVYWFPFREERKALNVLVDKLYERNKEKFKDREEVFEVFQKAMFGGNILPLGKLIDNTFGKGTFRKIGETDADTEALKKIIKEL